MKNGRLASCRRLTLSPGHQRRYHMDHNSQEPQLDIERIISEIRAAKETAEHAVPPEYRKAVLVEDQLAQNLFLANEHARISPVPLESRSLIKRMLYSLLQDLISQLNIFHADVVRVLNKLTRILNGDDPAPAEIHDSQRRRITLMEHLAERMTHYDRLHIEERLEALEKAVFQKK